MTAREKETPSDAWTPEEARIDRLGQAAHRRHFELSGAKREVGWREIPLSLRKYWRAIAEAVDAAGREAP